MSFSCRLTPENRSKSFLSNRADFLRARQKKVKNGASLGAQGLTDNCEIPLKCFVCSQTFDQYGNHVAGAENCVNLDGEEFLLDCDPFFETCKTETVTEWNPEGDQTYRVIRGCGVKWESTGDGDITCNQNKNGTTSVIYKDCTRHCEQGRSMLFATVLTHGDIESSFLGKFLRLD